MRVRLTQIDGALPNLALMKLSHWHRAKGDDVYVTRDILPDMFEDISYDRVYGSAIFGFSQIRLMRFQRQWPAAVVGGTGTPFKHTIEELIGEPVYEHYDYSGYPGFSESIGYAMRGCRMSGPKSVCRNFCVVPEKEGKPSSVNTIAAIWRGDSHPKKLHILDNDFFGNPEWRQRIDEIRAGKFKVCLSQGINTRLLNDEGAAALATIEYRNTRFNERRLYTAWDNFGDEAIFFKGVDRLERAGIPPKHLMAYMLIGCDPAETWDRIWHPLQSYGVDRHRALSDGVWLAPGPEVLPAMGTHRAVSRSRLLVGGIPQVHQIGGEPRSMAPRGGSSMKPMEAPMCRLCETRHFARVPCPKFYENADQYPATGTSSVPRKPHEAKAEKAGVTSPKPPGRKKKKRKVRKEQ